MDKLDMELEALAEAILAQQDKQGKPTKFKLRTKKVKFKARVDVFLNLDWECGRINRFYDRTEAHFVCDLNDQIQLLLDGRTDDDDEDSHRLDFGIYQLQNGVRVQVHRIMDANNDFVKKIFIGLCNREVDRKRLEDKRRKNEIRQKDLNALNNLFDVIKGNADKLTNC